MTDSFRTSATTAVIAAALAAAQAEIEMPARDRTVTVTSARTGSRYAFSYATLAAIMTAARPVAAHGIAIVQAPVDGAVTTRLMCGEEWVECVTPIKAATGDAQSYGSAVTYARRYAIAGLLAIVADEDDDGAAASGDTVHAMDARVPPKGHAPRRQPSRPVPPAVPGELPESERAAVGQSGADTVDQGERGPGIVQTSAAAENPYVIYAPDVNRFCDSAPEFLTRWQKALRAIVDRHVADPEAGIAVLRRAQSLNATALERLGGTDPELATEVLALMQVALGQLQSAASVAGSQGREHDPE